MGERGNGLSGLVATNGQPLVVNEKLRKVKIVYLQIPWFGNLLRMDGSKALRVTGLPEGAELLGNTPIVQTEQGPAIGMIYYHESFPIVLDGQQPAPLMLHVEEIEVESIVTDMDNVAGAEGSEPWPSLPEDFSE